MPIETGRESATLGSEATRTAWEVAETMNATEDGSRGYWMPWTAIRIVDALSPRKGEGAPDAETVARYAAHFDAMPPIEVQKDTLILIDGRHRLEAAPTASRDYIRVVERDIPDTELVEWAIVANVQHGRPLTHQQRMTAARLLYERHDPNGDESTAWTPERIAQWAGISTRTIREWMLKADQKARETAEASVNGSQVRQIAAPEPSKPATRLGPDNKRYPTTAKPPVKRTTITEPVTRVPDPDYVDFDDIPVETADVGKSGAFAAPTMRTYHEDVFRALSTLYGVAGDMDGATYVAGLGSGARESITALLPRVRAFVEQVVEAMA